MTFCALFALQQNGILEIMEERSLGAILLESTSLTEEQLQQGLILQREKGIKLGEALVQLKFLRTEDILKALSIQLGFPYESKIEVETVDPALVEHLPINYAKDNEVLPLRKDNGTIVVAVADPTNFQVIDDLRLLFHSNIKPVIAGSYEIVNAINAVYNKTTDKGEKAMTDLEEGMEEIAEDFNEPVDLLDASDEAPIIRLVNSLMFRAVKQKASDIHIEPFERDLAVRFRIDGVLYDVMHPPKRAQNSIISRVKIMAGLNIAEKRIPQDGRIRIKIAGKDIDMRVSTIPTAFGESVVMRLLDKSAVLLDISTLGFIGKNLDYINEVIQRPHGIILVTGPTGSGKTTTLYSALSKINTQELKIITVEDPVEYQLPGINQMQVNPKIDLTFATGLRAFLRQDPDVIMVGEIRDKETAEIAIQASLTGHLVFSTLHTNDACSSITRLVDMGVEPFLVSSSVICIMAQRLVRSVCKDCARKYTPEEVELAKLGLKPEDLKGRQFYRPVGCPNCLETGYSGRTGIHEILMISDPVRSEIMKGSDASTIKKVAQSGGMKTLREDAAQKILMGWTTVEEVLSITQGDRD
ncbi:MAG: type II secretion system protein GspE [Deltaproteobacteria bacterium RIFCSPLOWO2_12_FULL_44_12]|nr:MAG: type II secretion system protein GspE [Deltaproteobacteria bacterium RIFCSPHIGHO2_01_FULL_43_49]OGQ16197.1 MAG: type II secretion system protein GspE [Deltaproteobacteria bacterium RIFCSPHIGHO2_02_FULL_44_53]OGQ29157.1 MAG: type II secretion system protein GspE [Deltaproteobacteria bacterium RIFCSPHIGHO2_12_FULL_44_21]OGQ32714.1 MAG: type II secretion system protein GspE [Deltaproteobacteria bacterium RIFCSPLOWO2_01_FULL_45_74]OGQ41816.1 MAG: type II secretion system protein GspE [Delta